MEIARARAKAVNARRYFLKVTHHMTLEEYQALLEFQGGVCSVCGRPPAPGKNLHLDHDHAPARNGGPCEHPHQESCRYCWRGLVHRHCNDILAMARDSIEVLTNAIEHLKDPPAQRMINGDGTRET